MMTQQKLSSNLRLCEEFGAPDSALWRELTEKVLQGVPFEKKLVSRTPEGIEVQPIYGREVLEGNELADTVPGEFPYIRGTNPGGYASGTWEIRQGLGYATAEEFNAAAKRDLSRGQDALVLRFDHAGRQGMDPEERAGEDGTCITCGEDFEAALEGVELSGVAVHVEAGVSAPAAAEMLLSRGAVPPSRGSVCFDPLGELAVEGRLPMTLNRAWDVLAAHVREMGERAPGMRSIGVDVSWCGNSGGTAVMELACMLGSAAESFRSLEERGVSPEQAAGKMLVRFTVGTDFFMEIAKFRAARGLWAHMVRECGGGEEGARLCQHAVTSRWEQSVLDPYVNLLRGASGAFSAVVGGVDGLTVEPFDALVGPPNEFSRRIARNMQLVLRDEAHLTEVVDPVGGSWLVEELTRELAEKGWAKFQEMERGGGLIAGLRDGTLREELVEVAKGKKLKLAQRREVKVGVNQYANPEEKELKGEGERLGDHAEAALKRMKVLKSKRDETAVRGMLKELGADEIRAGVGGALRLGATVGEVMGALGAGGSYRVVPVKLDRLTRGYERLRANMAAYVAEHGEAPKVFLAQMGPVSRHKIRADFSAEFLRPSGFTVLAEGSYEDAASAARAAVECGAAAAVICSTDETYPELVPVFAKAVKEASPKTLVLVAGYPPEHVDAFKAAGVDEFIHLRANNLQLLSDLQALTGVAQ